MCEYVTLGVSGDGARLDRRPSRRPRCLRPRNDFADHLWPGQVVLLSTMANEDTLNEIWDALEF